MDHGLFDATIWPAPDRGLSRTGATHPPTAGAGAVRLIAYGRTAVHAAITGHAP